MTGALIKSDKASNQLSVKNCLKLCAFIVLATVVCQITYVRAGKETNKLTCGAVLCFVMDWIMGTKSVSHESLQLVRFIHSYYRN